MGSMKSVCIGCVNEFKEKNSCVKDCLEAKAFREKYSQDYSVFGNTLSNSYSLSVTGRRN